MEIRTKYSVGDRVFHAFTERVTKMHPCPDCLGMRVWKVTSPSGGEHSFPCPRCAARYQSYGESDLTYLEVAPSTKEVVIERVEVDTSKPEPTYLSGCFLYRESTLHTSEEMALEHAKAMAAMENAKSREAPRGKYQVTLDLSDYQLHNVLVKKAEGGKASAEFALADLLDDLDECETLEAVREATKRVREAE